MNEYETFLSTKHLRARSTGFDPSDLLSSHKLKDWQISVVRWACRRGTSALFLDTGLGKTLCQLAWAEQVCNYTGGNVLILCPLAVAKQTQREGVKFGITATVCRKQADVQRGINIANYEMLEHFDALSFAGVVLDESAILKNFMGKVKQSILDAFCHTKYKLACTATPAPNDHLELGNHAEFLDVMPSNEMISRWFINDTMKAGGYRLKGHAAADFWRWVSTWAVSIQKPSDLGDQYSDEGYILPELRMHEVVVDVDVLEGAGDRLFRDTTLSATNIHKEMRRTCDARATAVAKIIADDSEGKRELDSPWLVWCHTDYEADALWSSLKGSTEVRGSHKPEKKEKAAIDFSDNLLPILISKPRIFGSGLNFQNCCKVAFVGLSFSYESMYQAIRRVWRFGQQYPVDVYIVRATTEGAILNTIRAKEAAHRQMQKAMVEAMRSSTLEEIHGKLRLNEFAGNDNVKRPSWMVKKES